MEEIDIPAQIIGIRFVISALMDYIEDTDNGLRPALIKSFEAMLDGDLTKVSGEHHDLMRRALEAAIDVVSAGEPRPRLSIVPIK